MSHHASSYLAVYPGICSDYTYIVWLLEMWAGQPCTHALSYYMYMYSILIVALTTSWAVNVPCTELTLQRASYSPP